MSWTDERVETLKKMWAEGQSASQIAKELGGVTRNAVIGKVHRLGLSNRVVGAAASASAKPEPGAKTRAADPAPVADPGTADAEGDAPAAAPAVAAPAVVVPTRKPIVPAGQPLPPQPPTQEISAEAMANVRQAEKNARRLKLMELSERTCKWPIGDPATDDFWFCGLTSQAGKPYCEAHVALAFQPMSSRRDRRR